MSSIKNTAEPITHMNIDIIGCVERKENAPILKIIYKFSSNLISFNDEISDLSITVTYSLSRVRTFIGISVYSPIRAQKLPTRKV